MHFEIIVSDYLVCVGSMLFLCVAFSETIGGRWLNLPKAALCSLFLLIIGSCFGVLGSGDVSPLESIRNLLNAADLSSISSWVLYLTTMVVVYLASTLTPGGQGLITRFCCAIGLLTAVVVCALSIIQAVAIGQMSEQGTTFFSATFTVNAFLLGFQIFLRSGLTDLSMARPSEHLLNIAHLSVLVTLATTTLFALSFFICIAYGSPLFPNEFVRVGVVAAWTILLVFGILMPAGLLARWTLAKTDWTTIPRLNTLIIACVAMSGVALITIGWLSSSWSF